jgi:hypothetical protein
MQEKKNKGFVVKRIKRVPRKVEDDFSDARELNDYRSVLIWLRSECVSLGRRFPEGVDPTYLEIWAQKIGDVLSKHENENE